MTARAVPSSAMVPGTARVLPRKDPGSAGFGEVLRRILVDRGRQGLAQTATAIGLPMASLHAKLSGRARFSVAEFAAALRSVPDPRLIRWLFGPSSLAVLRHSDEQGSVAPATEFEDVLGGVEASVDILLDMVDERERRAPSVRRPSAIMQQIDAAMAEIVWMKRHAAAKLLADTSAASPHSDLRFGALVKRVLLNTQGVGLAQLAIALGLTNDSLHARIAGRVSFDPVELQTLFRRYPEPHIADVLLIGTPFVALLPSASDVTPLRAGVEALRAVLGLTTLPPGARWAEQADATDLVSRLNDAVRALVVMRSS